MTPRARFDTAMRGVPWEDLKWLVPIIMAVLSMFGTTFVAYTQNDKEVTKELTTLQERQNAADRLRQDDFNRLIRIEDKLDRLIERSVK